MCQEAVGRLCNPSERCHVRKVARLLARPLRRSSANEAHRKFSRTVFTTSASVSRCEPPHPQTGGAIDWARPPRTPEQPPRGSEKALAADRAFQFKHPLDETSQEASVLPQFLSTDVALLLQVSHLVSQSLNKRSISLELIFTSSLPSSIIQPHQGGALRTVRNERTLSSMRFLRASVLIPGSRAASAGKTEARVLQLALVYYWCKEFATLARGLCPVRRFGLYKPNSERADERTRTADLLQLRVIIHVLQGFAQRWKAP